jgi:hypothetical protein
MPWLEWVRVGVGSIGKARRLRRAERGDLVAAVESGGLSLDAVLAAAERQGRDRAPAWVEIGDLQRRLAAGERPCGPRQAAAKSPHSGASYQTQKNVFGVLRPILLSRRRPEPMSAIDAGLRRRGGTVEWGPGAGGARQTGGPHKAPQKG